MSVTLHHGDCLEVMRGMTDGSVDAVVTDPPYGLGFMGKAWDTPGSFVERKADKRNTFDHIGGNHNPTCSADAARTRAVEGRKFQRFCDAWAAECLRLLKPGGHLVAFGGSRTYHRMACAIEDAGFEIRDQLMYLYGSGFPKSHNLPGGLGTALKPAHEPIVLARKPLIGSVATNVLAHGTGALNIDGCRVATDENLSGGAYVPRAHGNAWAETGGMNKAGACAGQPYQQPAGRWPANLVHDSSPEVLAAFAAFGETNGSGKAVIGGTPRKTTGHVCSGSPDRSNALMSYGDGGTPARFFQSCPLTPDELRFNYTAKAGREERDKGLEGLAESARRMFASGGRTQINGEWVETNSDPLPRRNSHPTVKPISLMSWLVRLITPPGGTVLDPFLGSGSTAIACDRGGFSCIGIEQSAEYMAIARSRIKGDCPLFAEVA